MSSIDALESDRDEQLHHVQLTQQLHEKQQELEELCKKIRYIELEYKKKEIEKNAELANEKQRVQELQEIFEKKLSTIKDNKEVEQLYERLNEVENELFDKQQIAHDMLQQLTEMEQENINLKERIESISNGNENSNNLIKENADIDVDKLVSTCLSLEKQKEEVERELEQIKSGAIDTIVEKEKIIMYLQEEVEQLKAQIEGQNFQQNTGEIEEAVERVQKEYEGRLMASEEMTEEYQRRFEELLRRIEEMEISHQQEILNVEREMRERVQQNIQEHMDSARSAEADLMNELKGMKELQKKSEKQTVDLQRQLNQSKDDLRNCKEQLEAKQKVNQKLQEQVDEMRGSLKEYEEHKRSIEKELAEKNNSIEKLNAKREELLKLVVNLEAENKRFKDNFDHYKSLSDQQLNTIDELTEQADNQSQQFAQQIKRISEQYERERATLSEEIKKLQQQLEEERISSSQNSSKKNSQDIDAQQQQPLESKPNESEVRALDNTQCTTPKQQSITHDFGSSSSPSIEDNVASPPQISSETKSETKSPFPPKEKAHQQPKQTLLGLEFEDEDFAIEEEKTEKANETSGKKDQLKKSNDMTSSQDGRNLGRKEGGVNDLYNMTGQRASTRNSFKKQFMFPSSLQIQQQAPEIQIENESTDLKKQIFKLEKQLENSNQEIERLTHECKSTLKLLQEARKEKVMTHTEADLISELNSFKAHCNRVETQFVTQKLQLTEELHFFREEVKIFEKSANDSREQLLKMTQDKNYFQQKCSQLKQLIKQKRSANSLGGQSMFPESIEMLQQQQIVMNSANQTPEKPAASTQKKKSFWIFK